ncbi:MAG: HD domain-containing protein [Thermodesulfovibrionales bacterium]
MPEKLTALISQITVAMSNCALYTKEHPTVEQMAEKAVAGMEDLYSEGVLSLAMLGGDLVFNEVRVSERGLHMSSLIKRLRRKGVEKVVFRKGVSTEELKSFIASIVSPEGVPASSPHISVGAVDVALKDDGDAQAAVGENISRLKEVYHGASRFRALDMVGLEDVVTSFLSTLRREANILRVISPVKSYSEYTYTHATNVTILSIFQAERMGIGGDALYEIGLAGLLHDVGKIFISREVLEKKGSLSPEEWAEVKRHSVLGASYLSTLHDVPGLAIVAAFEHHMKFDGSGYPVCNRPGRRQHLASQIISISDFFDALRTERPYREALDLPSVLGLIKEGAGKDFNPALVRNLMESMKDFLAA